MLTTIAEWVRKHTILALISATSLGAGGATTAWWSIYEARVNRIEEMKVAEFNELVNETKKFREGLNQFTEELALNGVVNAKQRSELSGNLVRLYSGLSAFSVNVPLEKEEPIRNLQRSINEVKKRIQLTKVKQDLDPLGVALVQMFQAFEHAQPVIEEAVGKDFPIKA